MLSLKDAKSLIASIITIHDEKRTNYSLYYFYLARLQILFRRNVKTSVGIDLTSPSNFCLYHYFTKSMRQRIEWNISHKYHSQQKLIDDTTISFFDLNGFVGLLFILFKYHLELQVNEQLLYFLNLQLVVLSVIFFKDFSLFTICMTAIGQQYMFSLRNYREYSDEN